jgi:hypothetical protein
MEKTRMLETDEAVAGGTEGGRSPTGVPPATAAATGRGDPIAGNGKPIPDPGVPERPVRRRFTAEYKFRILSEADRSTARRHAAPRGSVLVAPDRLAETA